MSGLFPLRMLLTAVAAFTLSTTVWAEGSQKEVTKLDGKKVFGAIEITDDYTVKVTSENGIQKIPLALLSESDFKKLGFSKDRSNDGRFWSERQDALESAQKDQAGQKDDKSTTYEVSLKEIAPFQPAIDAYEKNLPDKKTADPNPGEKSETGASLTASGSSPVGKLFTQPTMGNTPFAGGFASPMTQPLSSAGAYIPVTVPTAPVTAP